MSKSIFEIVDYTKKYNSIMQFNKNKTVPIHQWYPFVEGYSKEFIESILDDIDYSPKHVLEPFAGSGTTPLELQFKNIKCTSCEVSPFMHLLTSVKLHKDYDLKTFSHHITNLKNDLNVCPRNITSYMQVPFGRTVIKTEKNNKKWNFNIDVIHGILDIKYAINNIEDNIYKNLFSICLSSILIEVSNVFRNGKCLSYKSNWEEKIKFSRTDVASIFINKLESLFKDDIALIQKNNTGIQVNNLENLHFGDIRENIKKIEDKSIDLIITSPPYLNSRDYTDIYMLELKILDLVASHEDLNKLRKNTLRSHVQTKHGELEILEIPLLKEYFFSISLKNIELWNNDLLNMIKGYFIDINNLFSEFKRVMIPNKRIYFNVANSAYFDTEIKVDEIICQIAEKHLFKVIEIRIARNLKASSQQSKSILGLRESVIVIES